MESAFLYRELIASSIYLNTNSITLNVQGGKCTSYPFYKKRFTFTQPDGSGIEVMGWGDRHHAVFETPGITEIGSPGEDLEFKVTIREIPQEDN